MPGRSLLDHILSVYPPGVELLKEAIRRLDAGEPLPGIAQNPESGSYFSFPETAELAALAERGFPLFDQAEYVRFLRNWVSEQEGLPL